LYFHAFFSLIFLSGNLDKNTEDEILNIFRILSHKENKCVIIVTHSKNVCDKSDVVYDLREVNEVVKKRQIKRVLFRTLFYCYCI
jgi:ABC-type lipoprotein export system ATPase subunit